MHSAFLRCLLAGSLVFSSTYLSAEEIQLSEKASRYHEALLGRPSSDTLYRRFVEAWREDGSTNELEQFLIKRADVGRPADWAVLARNQLLAGKEKEAMASFDKALAAGAEPGWIELEIARMHLRAGRFDEAIAHADKVPATAAEFPEAVRAAGEAAARAGQGEDAVARWTKALDAAPDDLDLLADLIRTAGREGQKEAALTFSQRRVEREKDPFKKTEARLDRADLLTAAGRTDEALAEWTAALDTSGTDSWLESEILTRAEKSSRNRQGDTGWLKQIAAWSTAFPNRMEIVRRHARALAATGDPNTAFTLLTELLKRIPGDQALRLERIDLLDRGNRLDEAAVEWRKLAADDPKNETPWLKLADLQFRLDRPAEIRSALEGLSKLSSADPLKQVNQSDLWFRYGLASEGEARLRELANGAAGAQAEQRLAQYLARIGRPKDAIEWWRKLGARPALTDLLAAAQGLGTAGSHDAAFTLLVSRQQEFAKLPDYRAAYAPAALTAQQPAKVLEIAADLLKDGAAAGNYDAAIGWIATATEAAGERDAWIRTLQENPARSVAETLLLGRLFVGANRPADADTLLGASTDPLLRDGHIALLQRQGKTREAVERLGTQPPADRLQEAAWQRRVAGLKRAAGDPAGALAACLRWRELAPEEMNAWLEEARLLLVTDARAAEKQLRKAVARFDKEPVFRTMLMEAVENNGDARGAIELAWQQYSVAENSADQSRWLHRLAELGQRYNLLPDIVEEFRTRGRRDPLSPSPWLGLAECAKLQNNTRDVVEALQQAAQRAPRDAAILGELATLDERSGNNTNAIARFEDIARLAPGPESARQLAQARVRNGQIARGLLEIQALAGEAGTDIRVIESTAVSVASAGWTEAAIDLLRNIDPKLHDIRSQLTLGKLLAIDGHEREANALFLAILRTPEPPPSTPEEEQARQGKSNWPEATRINQLIQTFTSSIRNQASGGVASVLQNTYGHQPGYERDLCAAHALATALTLDDDVWRANVDAIPILKSGSKEEWRQTLDEAMSYDSAPSASLPPESGGRLMLLRYMNYGAWNSLPDDQLSSLHQRLRKAGIDSQWQVLATLAGRSDAALAKHLQEFLDHPETQPLEQTHRQTMLHTIASKATGLQTTSPPPPWVPLARKWIEGSLAQPDLGPGLSVYYRSVLIRLLDAMGDTEALVATLNAIGRDHLAALNPSAAKSPPPPPAPFFSYPYWQADDFGYQGRWSRGYAGLSRRALPPPQPRVAPADARTYPLYYLNGLGATWCKRLQPDATLKRLESPVLRAYVAWTATSSLKQIDREIEAQPPFSEIAADLVAIRWTWDVEHLEKRTNELESWAKRLKENPGTAQKAWSALTGLAAKDKDRRTTMITRLTGLLDEPANALLVSQCAPLLRDQTLVEKAQLLYENQMSSSGLSRTFRTPQQMGFGGAAPLIQIQPHRTDWQKIAKLVGSNQQDLATAEATRALEGVIRTWNTGYDRSLRQQIQSLKPDIKGVVDAALKRLAPGPDHGLLYRINHIRLLDALQGSQAALEPAEALARLRPSDPGCALDAILQLPPNRQNEAFARLDALAGSDVTGFRAAMRQRASSVLSQSSMSGSMDEFELLGTWQSRPGFNVPGGSPWRIGILSAISRGLQESNGGDAQTNAARLKRLTDLVLLWTELCLDDPETAEAAFQLCLSAHKSSDSIDLLTAARRVIGSGAYATSAAQVDRNGILRVHQNSDDDGAYALEFLLFNRDPGAAIDAGQLTAIRAKDPDLADWIERFRTAKSAPDFLPLLVRQSPSSSFNSGQTWPATAKFRAAVRRAAELPKAGAAVEALIAQNTNVNPLLGGDPRQLDPLFARALEDAYARGPKEFGQFVTHCLTRADKATDGNPHGYNADYLRQQVIGRMIDAAERPVIACAVVRHLADARIELPNVSLSSGNARLLDPTIHDLAAALKNAGIDRLDALARIGFWTRTRQNSHGFDGYDIYDSRMNGENEDGTPPPLSFNWLATEALSRFSQSTDRNKLFEASAKKTNASAAEWVAVALLAPAGPTRTTFARKALDAGAKEFGALPAGFREPMLNELFGAASPAELAALPEMVRAPLRKNRKAQLDQVEKDLEKAVSLLNDNSPTDPYRRQRAGGVIQQRVQLLAQMGEIEGLHHLLVTWAEKAKGLSASTLDPRYRSAALLQNALSSYPNTPGLLAATPAWREELSTIDSTSAGRSGIESFWNALRQSTQSSLGSQAISRDAWGGLTAVSPKVQATYLMSAESLTYLLERQSKETVGGWLTAAKSSPLLTAAIHWHAREASGSSDVSEATLLDSYTSALAEAGVSAQEVAKFALARILESRRDSNPARPDEILRITTKHLTAMGSAATSSHEQASSLLYQMTSRSPLSPETITEAGRLLELLLGSNPSAKSADNSNSYLMRTAEAIGRQDLMVVIIRKSGVPHDNSASMLQEQARKGRLDVVAEILVRDSDAWFEAPTFTITTERLISAATAEGKLADARGLLLRTFLSSGLDGSGGNETPAESRDARITRLQAEFQNSKIEEAAIRRALYVYLAQPAAYLLGRTAVAEEFREVDWSRLPTPSDDRANGFQKFGMARRLLTFTTCSALHAGDTASLQSFTHMLESIPQAVTRTEAAQSMITQNAQPIALTLLVLAGKNGGTLPEPLRPVTRDFLTAILNTIGATSTSSYRSQPFDALALVLVPADEDPGKLAPLVAPAAKDWPDSLQKTLETLQIQRVSRDVDLRLTILKLAAKTPRLARFLENSGRTSLWDGMPAEGPTRAAFVKEVLGDPALRAKLAPVNVASLPGRNPTSETVDLIQLYLNEQRGRLDPEAAKRIESWIEATRKKLGGEPSK
ncbi:hypothetical protein [Luteolibacter sp. LG18]|uniref:tetratricopeptide repeat protein n=1 Tax=Luteolibacter sp. LG18 TaxID=2819286 RepID=UPI002B3209BE|nr:hypothetical protein llg_06520 [Luteolibacter sp. LG18]